MQAIDSNLNRNLDDPGISHFRLFLIFVVFLHSVRMDVTDDILLEAHLRLMNSLDEGCQRLMANVARQLGSYDQRLGAAEDVIATLKARLVELRAVKQERLVIRIKLQAARRERALAASMLPLDEWDGYACTKM